MEQVEILLVEDDDRDARHIERLLVEGTDTATTVRRATSLSAARTAIETPPDAAVLDLNLPDSDGLDTVEAVVETAPHVPVVVVTGRDSDLGRAAIRRGAQDYLSKGQITAPVLVRTLRYAIDRQETQREMAELNQRLELLNRMVRRNVRADLQVVVGRGDELREHVDPARTETLETMLDAADHALEHTETAGALLDALDDDHRREPLDVAAVAGRQVERARERFEAAFTLETPADETTVETTPALGRALAQLLENAVRHNDSERPEVTVRVEATANRVSVSVADNGVGLSESQQRLLDDPEARYHERSGLGTGLYLAATLLTQAGGTLSFAANDPQGTVVTMTLDRSPAA